MGVTIELQNLGNAQLCREIIANVEHALSDKRGEWRVSITGSRVSENWDMRVEGQAALNGRILWRVLQESMSPRQFVD